MGHSRKHSEKPPSEEIKKEWEWGRIRGWLDKGDRREVGRLEKVDLQTSNHTGGQGYPISSIRVFLE